MVGIVSREVKRRSIVLVVGSGPVGSTFARVVTERVPGAQILMIEAGPVLTDPPGVNLKNLDDADERRRARELSRGPTGRRATTQVGRRRHDPGSAAGDAPARPDNAGIPEAAASTYVGGMGAHWTCAAAPVRVSGSAFIPDPEPTPRSTPRRGCSRRRRWRSRSRRRARPSGAARGRLRRRAAGATEGRHPCRRRPRPTRPRPWTGVDDDPGAAVRERTLRAARGDAVPQAPRRGRSRDRRGARGPDDGRRRDGQGAWSSPQPTRSGRRSWCGPRESAARARTASHRAPARLRRRRRRPGVRPPLDGRAPGGWTP